VKKVKKAKLQPPSENGLDRFEPCPESELTAVPGDMTKDEYLYIIRQLGLDSASAALWMGYTPRQGFRYANGDVAVPRPIGKMLTLMMRRGLTPEQV
jgi:hypothetical protein